MIVLKKIAAQMYVSVVEEVAYKPIVMGVS
jgi:hypothetical protein